MTELDHDGAWAEIDGTPIPMPRPRFCQRTRRAIIPKVIQLEKARIQWRYVSERNLKKLPGKIESGPIAVEVDFIFKVPKTKPDLIGGWKCSKPDGDNLLKLVLDALNGVAWSDDAQVAMKLVRKRYGIKSMTRIRVWQLHSQREDAL